MASQLVIQGQAFIGHRKAEVLDIAV